jgi:hypothetical protein
LDQQLRACHKQIWHLTLAQLALWLFACLAVCMLTSVSVQSPKYNILVPSHFFCCLAQMNRASNNVPIVNPPERVAGYFKLNRTVDAHMFYFFYESRWVFQTCLHLQQTAASAVLAVLDK